MNYISETVKLYQKREPEIGDLVLQSICSTCPAGVWQIQKSKNHDGGNLICLCTKLSMQSYSISQDILEACDYHAVALQEFELKSKD